MDTSRPHDPSSRAGVQWASSYPYATGQQPPNPPRRTYPPEPVPVGQRATYPYEQRPPQQVHQQPPAPQPRRSSRSRRLLGVVAFFVLTALSLPLHIAAIFFIYVEFESPGDPATAVLLIGAAFLGSFAALLVTGVLSQRIGGFPGRWRARITLAAFSGIIALAVAYFAALRLL